VGSPDNPGEPRISLAEGYKIRAALPDDKQVVFEFCQNTWEWGDYIPQVWDAWINDPKGRLLVATFNDRPVAVAHLTLPSPEEAWLQGFRVAPGYRNKGIATELTQYCQQLAVELGAKVIRYTTLSSNFSARHVAAKLGFHQVASFASYQADVIDDSPWQLSVLGSGNLAAVLFFINGSSEYKSSAGLYCTGWAYHKLTPDKLENHLASGEVFTTGQIGELRAIAVVTMTSLSWGKVIGFMAGSPDDMHNLALALRANNVQDAASGVEARLPDLPSVRDSLSSAGYTLLTEAPFLVLETEI